MPVRRLNELVDDRVDAIARYHADTGIARAQLDLSGGIDSAVMLGLLARAVGPDRLTVVHSGIHSSPEHLARARETADAFGAPLHVIDLTDLYEGLVSRATSEITATLGEGALTDLSDPTILGSIRSTLRAPVGRAFNRLTGGGIRHGTGNECEDRWLRFYQKGGDGEVDTNPIAMLSKGEVFQLAHALGVPNSTLRARPSPDLWGVGDGHEDETEIGSFLGLCHSDHPFYGQVDPDTGAYLHSGLIERVSRFDDAHPGLFADRPFREVLRDAAVHPALRSLETEFRAALLNSARKAERVTRHKFNPACPTLGNRGTLVEAGILDDTLPEG